MLVSPHFQEPSLSEVFNPLPDDKYLDWSKFKAFEDNTVNVIAKLKFVLGRVEDFVGKGKNAGFPTMFSETFFFSGSLKVVLQILGQTIYKSTKKSSLYSQSLLIFIHRTLVFERHPTTREIRFTTSQVDNNGKCGLF